MSAKLSAEHPQRGHVAEGLRLVEEQTQRGLQGGQRQLSDPHDAGQRILADGLDQVGPAENDARLGCRR